MKSPWRANVYWIKDPCCERGLSADQYISSHGAADRYHQHPLHETSPSTLASSACLRLNRCDFKGLSLLISLKSSCSGRLGDSAASCSYCTEGIAQASARATTRGDEAGACASVAAMIHLPADVPFVLHRPVHL
jgi:hypothetical protein